MFNNDTFDIVDEKIHITYSITKSNIYIAGILDLSEHMESKEKVSLSM